MIQLRIASDSSTKFKIIGPKLSLSLKADSPLDREQWIEAITAITKKFGKGAEVLIGIDTSSFSERSQGSKRYTMQSPNNKDSMDFERPPVTTLT